MKKRVLLFLLIFLLSPAVCQAAYYTVKMTAPTENYALRYEDDDIYVIFGMARKNPDRIFISIYNKTDSLISAKWDKSSIVLDNKAHRVLPASQLITGVSGMNSIASSSIPPNSSFDESLFAEGYIAFINEPVVLRGGIGFGHGWGGYRRWGGWAGYDDLIIKPGWYGSWRTKPFFPAKKADIEKKDPVGSVLSLYIPLLIKETETVKRFSFTVDYLSISESPGLLGISVADQKELGFMKKDLEIEKGVVIIDLSKKSPSKDAGLKENDNIIKINDTEINSLEDFYLLMKNKKAKEKILLTYLRNGKKQTATVTLKKI